MAADVCTITHDTSKIKFGSFDIEPSLEEQITQLQQEKQGLIKSLIERENILQKEKDKYMADMSIYLYNTNLKYQEQSQVFVNQIEMLSNELTKLKTEHIDIANKYNISQEKIKKLESKKDDINKKSSKVIPVPKTHYTDNGTNCLLINFSEFDALKILCKNLEEDNKKLEIEIQRLKEDNKKPDIENKNLKEDYKKLYDNYKKLQVDYNKLQNDCSKLQEENKKLNKPKEIIKVATHTIGLTCSMPNEFDGVVKAQIKTIEKLSHDLNNERDLSAMMSISNCEKDKVIKEKDIIIKDKDKMITAEKTLRSDLQYMLDTIRMYLEIEMMKISAEINANGLRGFTCVAFNMYRGYCEGKLDQMINEAVETRTKVKI
jgi:chromosome segregation ATPase